MTQGRIIEKQINNSNKIKSGSFQRVFSSNDQSPFSSMESMWRNKEEEWKIRPWRRRRDDFAWFELVGRRVGRLFNSPCLVMRIKGNRCQSKRFCDVQSMRARARARARAGQYIASAFWRLSKRQKFETGEIATCKPNQRQDAVKGKKQPTEVSSLLSLSAAATVN